MKLLPLAKRRPSPAAMDLPQLFARQSTDCSSGAFYRCSLNNFAGCCSVDPCALTDGCPDDEDEDEPDEDEPDEDENEEPSSTEREETTSTTEEEKTTTISKTRTATATVTLTNDSGEVTSVVTTSLETDAALPTDLAETDGSNPDSNSDSDDSGGGLSAGAIAGIAVGIAVLLIVIAALLFCRRRRRRAAAQSTEAYPAHTPTDEKFLSTATTPAGFTGKFGSRAPTPSTPGRSDGNGRYSYVSSMTASPPPGNVAFPRGMGEHPGIAQLDSEPVATIAEMDGAAARPSELPATPIGAAGTPARGLGLGTVRQGQQGQAQAQGQSTQLPTVAEVEPGLRATLNPTEGERSQQTYVTSWSEFGGKQVGGNGGT